MAICLVAVPVLLPIVAIVAIVVRFGMGSPVLFRQVRPGLHEKPFTILKFRTMRDEYDRAGRLRPDEQRLTALGALLRKLSLDELPQMWNVLAGHMSLVGPRPLLMDYLSCYSERHRNRHTVKPGITGWAQVCGRNAISWEERLELDMWYVEHRSFLFDLRILFLTVKCVLLRHGVSNADHATMTEFTGLQNSPSMPPCALNAVMAASSNKPHQHFPAEAARN